MILLNSLLNFNLPSASKICLSAILAVRPSTSRRKRVFSYVLHIKIENLNHVKFLKIVQILNFAPPFAERRVSSFVRPTKYVCNDWNTKFYSLILIFFMNALICFLKPNLRLHFENSFINIGWPYQKKSWLVTMQLFLKHVLNPYHGQENKSKLFLRWEVERTALSESIT